MPVFYTLHNVLPNTFANDGKRNCATFMYGVCVYAVIYILLKNLQLRFGVVMDAFISAFTMIVLADMTTMAYIYRYYYGRSILHEITPDDKTQWVYKKETHEYRPKSDAELLAEHIKTQKEMQQVIDGYKKELKTQRIVERKTRIRAAIYIQRWWRGMLYNPPNGIFYKRSLDSFNVLKHA